MLTKRFGWRSLVLTILVVGALVAVACGGGDPDPTSRPAPTAAPAATTAPAPAATTAPAPTAMPAATATAVPPTAMPEEPAGGGDLVIGVPSICPPIFNNRFLTGSCFERVQMWGFTEGLTWMAHAAPPVQVDEEDSSKSMVESWDWDEGANTLHVGDQDRHPVPQPGLR